MAPLLSLADPELAQRIATAALLPVEKRASFFQRVAAVRGSRGAAAPSYS